MRPIDADKLERHCKAVIEQSWNHASAPESWVQAFATFLDLLETAPTITADDYFGTVDRIKPCRNCRYTLLGELTEEQPGWHLASEPPEESGEYNVMIRGAANSTALFYSVEQKAWFGVDQIRDEKEVTCYEVDFWQPMPKPPERTA